MFQIKLKANWNLTSLWAWAESLSKIKDFNGKSTSKITQNSKIRGSPSSTKIGKKNKKLKPQNSSNWEDTATSIQAMPGLPLSVFLLSSLRWDPSHATHRKIFWDID